MGIGLGLRGHFQKGKKSVAFGTAIDMLLQPKANYRTVLTTLWVTAAGTAHVLTVMRPISPFVTLTAGVAAGASYVLPVSADPGTVASLTAGTPNGTTTQLASNVAAASDYVVTTLPDGTFFLDTIASVATLNWTMTGTLPTNGAASGAKVWWFGITSDKDAFNAEAHPGYTIGASATTKLQDYESGVVIGLRAGEPIILDDNNATATGTIELASGGYVRE